MKIFSAAICILLALTLCFLPDAFANDKSKKNSDHGHKDGSRRNNGNEVIVANGVTVITSFVNGIYYVNGIPIGGVIYSSVRNGTYYINGVPITSYANYNPAVTLNNNPVVAANDGSIQYLQAFTKFSFKDYLGAVNDCKEAIKINPKNAQAIVLLTVAQGVLDGKVSDNDVKNYSIKKIAQIVQDSNLQQ